MRNLDLPVSFPTSVEQEFSFLQNKLLLTFFGNLISQNRTV